MRSMSILKWISLAILLYTLTAMVNTTTSISVAASNPVTDQQDTHQQALFHKFDQLHTEQVILVTATNQKTFKGTLQIYNKQNGQWTLQIASVPVVLGKNGVGKIKEGDGKTPLGTYSLGTAFGTASKPTGLKVNYQSHTSQDYWVNDVSSSDYNQKVTETGNPNQRWASYERMDNPLYKYGMVINYNTDPIIKGKGSAIFMHIWRASNRPTDGCIALSEANLLQVLQVIDPAKSPKIRIGTVNAR